jgi:predicted PurR-regulated permease PerM
MTGPGRDRLLHTFGHRFAILLHMLRRFYPYAPLVLALSMLGIAITYFGSLVLYFFFSLIFSLILTPVARALSHVRIRKKALPPWLISLVCIVLGFSVLFFILIMFVPLLVKQAQILTNLDYQQLFASFERPLSELNTALNEADIIDRDLRVIISEYTRKNVNALLNSENLSAVFSGLLGFTGDLFITLFSVTFITFFMLKDGPLIRESLIAILPEAAAPHAREILNRIGYLLSRYLVGLVLQVTAITIIVSSAFTVLGLENGLIIGLFAGLANLIPYLGPTLGAIFGLVITLSTNLEASGLSLEILPLTLQVLAVFAGMQLVDNAVFQPLIFSSSVRAHPLEIFTVILLGGRLGGILAMVLAIPTYTIIRVIAQELYQDYLRLLRRSKGQEAQTGEDAVEATSYQPASEEKDA